ncbi:tyrosine-type recombinase/integrase [Mucilaginibacter sp.]
MPTISLYLDDRKTRKEKPVPPAALKLRVYLNRENIKHFKTKLSLTRAEFENSYLSSKPSGNANKNLKTKIEAIKIKADDIIEALGDHFTFEKFEKEFYRNRVNKNDIISHYNEKIKELDENGKASTADLYRLSLKSILKFAQGGKKEVPIILPFNIVTPKFLLGYENWFVNYTENGQSKTSVGMYLRNLRAIFNNAIEAGDIHKDLYPFKSYTIPTGKNTKKAVLDNVLKELYEAVVIPDSHIDIARNYWFFSFQCNGMNFRDIAELKYKDIHDTYFSFLRHKTKNTTKDDPIPIIVPLTENIMATIQKHGNKPIAPNSYVFPIFKAGMDEKEKLRVNRNFIRYVNGHMQKLADRLKLGIKLGTNVARHAFTTKVTKMLGLEFAQESLGHTTLTTTQNYWAGFEKETKKEMADKLMKF